MMGYRINLDALLARLVYRWRVQMLLCLGAIAASCSLLTGLLPPLWKGKALLVVLPAAGATVQVDGRDWPHNLYAGWHRVQARLPDGRQSWADVLLAPGQPLTLTLPAGLPAPSVREIRPPLPGMALESIWWADGGWRYRSRTIPAPASAGQPAGPPRVDGATHTLAIRAHVTERLMVIDAYGGLADEVHVQGRRVEAVYRPAPEAAGSTGRGTVVVQGWGSSPVTLPFSAPLGLLQFSPHGTSLLLAETLASTGNQLWLARPDTGLRPLVAIPGTITRTFWQPDAAALALYSRTTDRLVLTLLRLQPPIASVMLAELPFTAQTQDLLPMAWEGDRLLWIMPAGDGTSALWRVALPSLLTEKVAPLAAAALLPLGDGSLRVITTLQGQVVVARATLSTAAPLVVEGTLPGVVPAPDLSGIWHEPEVLVLGAGRAWLVVLGEPAPSGKEGR